MPSVINGIGTWYYGQKNVHVFTGTCQFCQRLGQLKTYDTNLFFVVLFIPIIPLGGRKILNECPYCKRHQLMALKKWESTRTENIKKSVEAYCENPFDEAKARDAINTTVFFRAEEAFRGLTTIVDASFPISPAIQSLLGEAHLFFGNLELAIEHYQKALAAEPDAQLADALAKLYLRAQQPEAAGRCLRYIYSSAVPGKLPLLYLLVEGYQAKGQHTEALRTLNEIAAAFPDAADSIAFKTAQKTSQKNIATGKPVASRNLAAVTPGFRSVSPWRSRLPKLIPLALLLGAILVYLACAFAAGNARTLYLTNGLAHAYQVHLAGQSYSVPPHSYVAVTLAEGRYDLTVTGQNVFVEPQSFTLETPFFARPFGSPTFLLNPDRAAVIIYETHIYSESGIKSPPADAHTGELFYQFSHIDYVFEESPPSLSVQDTHQSINKYRIDILRKVNANTVLNLSDKPGPQVAADFVKRHLVEDPTDLAFLNHINMLPPQESLEILRSHLDIRPIDIEWHRSYQDMALSQDPGPHVREQYAPLVAKEPNSGPLLYLLGRVTDDRAQARTLFTRATQAHPPVSYAYHALAFDHFAAAEFPQAVDLWKRAIALDPTNDTLLIYYEESLVAVNRLDEALAISHQLQARTPAKDNFVGYFHYVSNDVGLLAHARRFAEAREAIETAVTALGTKENTKPIRDTLESVIAYNSGDAAGYLRLTASDKSEQARFTAALMTNQLPEASAILLPATPNPKNAMAPDYQLLFYAVAQAAGRADLATKHLDHLVVEYRKGGPDLQKIANWLAGTVPTLDDTRDLSIPPKSKAILLAALAQRYPTHHGEFAQQAQLYNYQTSFPYLTLQKLVANP